MTPPVVVTPSRHAQCVLNALAADPTGMTINELHRRCGGTVAETSLALMALEGQGRGRFAGGRWRLIAGLN